MPEFNGNAKNRRKKTVRLPPLELAAPGRTGMYGAEAPTGIQAAECSRFARANQMGDSDASRVYEGKNQQAYHECGRKDDRDAAEVLLDDLCPD